MAVEFGAVVPAGPVRGEVDRLLDDMDRLVEALPPSFKSVWMTDHFFWDDKPTHECWTVLAFAAARWSHLHVGPIVLGQGYRNPALTAKMASTLQVLSGGRLIMGIGAGWKEDEYHAYGYPYPSPGVRVGQLEDTLEIFKRLWTQPGAVTYHGAHYQIENAYCEPKPPAIPLLVGGKGDKVLRLAARYADIWNLPDSNFDHFNERLNVLKGHCVDLGRDLSTLRLSWFGRLSVARTQEEAEARSSGKRTARNAFVGTPEQVRELLKPFIDAGVSLFIFEILGGFDTNILHYTIEEVLAKV